jgi:hypothetical protein
MMLVFSIVFERDPKDLAGLHPKWRPSIIPFYFIKMVAPCATVVGNQGSFLGNFG